MPPAVIPIIAIAATAALPVAAAAIGLGTIATAAFVIGGGIAIGAAASALTPRPSIPGFAVTGAGAGAGAGSAQALRNIAVMAREPASSRKLVYGRTKLSGPIVFLETTNNNRDLHVVVAFTGHEVTSFDSVFFEDKVVRNDLANAVEVSAMTTTNPNYAPKTLLTAHFGNVNQAANSNLVARTSWTTAHRLRNVSYIYARLEFDEDVFANGLPNISAIIKGRRLFDPRNNTTAFSDNAALCIRDFLTDTTYGLGATGAEIDDDSFIAAANICDESVSVLGGGSEKRYTINGVVDTANTPKQILEGLLTACGGSLYWSNGKWRIKVGAYITPTDSLNEDDLAGPVTLKTRTSNQEQFNAVKGLFLSENNNFQPSDYPEQTSTVFQSQDGGERKYVDLPLVYTNSPSAAQRIARQFLRNGREQIILQVVCKMSAFRFEVGDVINVNNDRFGFVNKPFEVVSWAFAQTQGGEGQALAIGMTLKETSPQIYAWDAAIDERVFEFNNTTLPSAFDLSPPGISISDELQTFNEEAISVLIVDVTSSNPFVNRFEVQARKLGESTFVNLGQGSGVRFELVNVEDNAIYEVRARQINTFGVKSQFVLGAHQVVGKTAPPSQVQGFTGNVVSGSLVLTWNPVPDLDLSHYKIRFSSAVNGAEYQNSVLLQPRIGRPATSTIVPARTGTYFIKAVDKLGNVSLDPGIIRVVTNIDAVENLNVVANLIEHPDFAGQKNGTVALDNRLILDTEFLFDDTLGLFDDALGLFDAGFGSVVNQGIYNFDNNLDLGEKFTSRVTAKLSLLYLDYVDTFDGAPGLFDSREGFFDGDPQKLEDIDVQLQVRTTDDDPALNNWSDYQPFVVGDYTARAFEFRAILISLSGTSSPAVTELEVEIDMPDRVFSEDDILTGAAPFNVTFTPAFRETPSIGLAIGDLQTGDFYEITNKTRSGFTIVFKNSAGTPISRRFDYIAKGFGRAEA